MAIAKRVFLFLFTNILILITLSITLQLLGFDGYYQNYGIDYSSLMIFCLVWGMGGAFISLGLSRIMAKWSMGVKVIPENTQAGPEGELLRTVHSLARKAGLTTMPEVGIYDSPEVNAFATGPTKNRSLVAVSSGLLYKMNKDQVEGVLGHEIAHIANGDMVTMTLLQGIINAFVMFLARAIAAVIQGDDKSFWKRMLIIIGLEIVFSLLGSILVAWFSRWREYRADAGGSRLAGREKMISALKALSNTEDLVENTNESLASFKISGKPKGFLALFSTHPPLEDRIRRLETGR